MDIARAPDPLSPTQFLERAASCFGQRPAVVDGDRTLTYIELAERCNGLARSLPSLGLGPGEVVSVLAPNTSVALEATLGVPRAGAVLNALNTRLSPAELAYIVEHAGARLLLVSDQLEALAREVAGRVPYALRVIIAGGDRDEYEAIVSPSSSSELPEVRDELSLLAINYTSGTTGPPKGVMYSHRGAFLQAVAMVSTVGLSTASRFLWTLPLFHCNGWCFPWSVTAAGGTHVMLPEVEASAIWDAIRTTGVTHLNAAPTVLTMIASGPWAESPAPRRLTVATGGAPPSPTLLSRLEELNLDVIHLYGLTETYGPAVVCEWWPEWNDRSEPEQMRLRARQGIPNLIGHQLRVADPETGADVAPDGVSTGEVLVRGNNVMLGYYRDPEATAAAFRGEWLRTGDIGVMHPDGYIELRDRLKDIIISGGENIASIEVEHALASHPAVLECAVVARPDAHWGEVPVAFVELRGDAVVAEADLVEHVRQRLARFKAPKRINFGPLPRTATGKVQKFVLRDEAKRQAAADTP